MPIPGAEPDRLSRTRLRGVLDRLEPAPALVINAIGDVLASTRGGHLVFGPIGMLEGAPSNLSRYVFTDPRAKSAFPDWESVADRVAVQLRLDHCAQTEPLIDELTRAAGAPFADRIGGPLVVPDRFGDVQLNHPDAGMLRLTYETLDLFVGGSQHVILYLAADEATTRFLDRLIGGAG